MTNYGTEQEVKNELVRLNKAFTKLKEIAGVVTKSRTSYVGKSFKFNFTRYLERYHYFDRYIKGITAEVQKNILIVF